MTRTNQVYPTSDNWYFHDVQPGRQYLAEITTLTQENKDFTILRSNSVGTPPKYLDTFLEPNIRFSKPTLKDFAKQEEHEKLPLRLPDNWRHAFTGYNLVKGRKEVD